jgi:glycosyltransferase involved in cell wall biosynthesis
LFALEVLEKVSSIKYQVSSIKLIFDLYGTIYNASYWKECQLVINRLPSNITVNFCGSLEKEKVQATLKEYDFLFMPSQGENFGHSIIESLLAGCPVIISDRTPWRNLNIEERQQTTDNRQQKAEDRPLTSDLLSPSNTGVGWDVPLEKPELFVQIIGQCCLMGENEYGQMSSNASAFAKQVSMNDAVRKATKQLFE